MVGEEVTINVQATAINDILLECSSDMRRPETTCSVYLHYQHPLQFHMGKH